MRSGAKEGLGRKHLAEEALGRVEIPAGCEEKVDRIAVLIDGSVEVAPLTADLDVRLVDAHRAAMRLAEPA